MIFLENKNSIYEYIGLKDFFFLIQSLLSLFSINDTISSTSETRDSLGDYKKEKNKQTKKSDLLCCQYMSVLKWTKFPTRCKVKLVR